MAKMRHYKVIYYIWDHGYQELDVVADEYKIEGNGKFITFYIDGSPIETHTTDCLSKVDWVNE